MEQKNRNNKYKKDNKSAAVSEFGKLPPQAPEIEESVLGALMVEKNTYSKIADILNDTSFYKPEHSKIYKAIRELGTKDDPIDLHTVSERLRKNGELDEIGGAYYITSLTAKVASAAHLEYHAYIIAQKAIARELITISSNIQSQAFDEETDVDDLLENAETKIFEISQRNLKNEVKQINPIVKDAIKRIELARLQEGGLSGVTSGFHVLDQITSGWQASDLIIIAARPAMGKTAFVLSMAKNMAVDHQIPSAVFSLEMSNIQLVNRLLMNVCEIEGDKIRTGKLEEEEWDKLTQRLKKLDNAPLFIDDTPSLSIAELRSKARLIKKEHDIKIIVIDYLQLMSAGNTGGAKFGSREQEVSLISRSLKALAKELDIPIIALSQLNRGVENRTGNEGKRPQLSDLRESGAIEQDADMVCFIHRPEYYKITEDSNGNSLLGIGEIIVAKHRNGAVGDVSLRFRGQYARFENLSAEDTYTEIPSKINSENQFNNESTATPIANTDDSTPF